LISDIPSLVEASGGYAKRFCPTREGIADALRETFSEEAVIQLRPQDSMRSSLLSEGQRMWKVIQDSLA